MDIHWMLLGGHSEVQEPGAGGNCYCRTETTRKASPDKSWSRYMVRAEQFLPRRPISYRRIFFVVTISVLRV